jgi:D-methionine transport system substrate-binding protein
MKRSLFTLALTAVSLFGAQSRAETKDVSIGATIGDFADMVNESVKPQLEKKGYKVKLVQFTDYVQPNIALAEKRLDANIFQHKPYLDEFAKEKGLKLSPLVQIPTAPLGIYAGKKSKLADISKGSTVAVPNDSTNLARALRLIADLGWIELKSSDKLIQIGLKDITKNTNNLKIVQLEAAQLPRSKDDVDFVVINGNYAVSSGIGLKAALSFEKSDAYLNWAVVRTEDLSSSFANDLKAALSSAEFKTYAKKKFEGYRYPSDWK